MQRYFIPTEQFGQHSVVLAGDDAYHIQRVMRAEPGTKLICSNGIDREAVVAITHMTKQTVEAEIVEELPMEAEPSVHVWIAQSLPKADKMELVIQKGTEIGAARFIPFTSERTVVQYDHKKEIKRLERWRKIAKEAAEQAHRNRIPELSSPSSWKELLRLGSQVDLALLCYEKQHTLSFRALLEQALAGEKGGEPYTILIAIGPEGGFTPAEAAEAEQAGYRPVSLGRRILRTETAAMVALSAIMYAAGEMGGGN
ncbi:16S rRNA (uracil(1498)-N(3))-methyltransferase [Paenibacillus senegalensis]|uniref:16S rRNA (uracil(1498)-N(3))-methyltransferase n=1 Tax=Paenibacillus senegalensis TaxID=1465766 RepID=UPI000289BE1D|nr:16S rRNA (uracil(1498)-N(3))-methyltransferase [Paenibacillus senegalensis]